MKSRKLLLPIVIWAVTIMAMAVCAVIFMIVKKPTITEQTFPFTITYEFNGETLTIEDVYTVCYIDNGDSRLREYSGKIGEIERDGVVKYTLRDDANGCIVLDTGLCPHCMMGDPSYDCTHEDPMKPQLIYDDAAGMRYRDEESLMAQGVKLIDWEYPTPIENTFVFSHLTILSGSASPVLAMIGVLSVLATLVWVKPEKNQTPKQIDQLSLMFHYLIGFIGVPLLTIAGALSDITGSNDNFFHQLFYFTSAFMALGVAASIALRRKGFSKSACIVQLVIPAIIAFLMLLSSVGIL